MANYRPQLDNTIPLVLLVPTYTNSFGVEKKSYPTIEEALSVLDENNNPVNLFYGSFKTYGGTEKVFNDVYSVEDTAKVETWFRPEIKSNCAIGVLSTFAIYEIIGEPENVNMRNQFLKFKVRRIKGQS